MLTIKERSTLIALAIGLPVLAGLFYLVIHGGPRYNACRDKGIAFHRSTGDYPTIKKSHENAVRVVEDLCRRTTDAYGKADPSR